MANVGDDVNVGDAGNVPVVNVVPAAAAAANVIPEEWCGNHVFITDTSTAGPMRIQADIAASQVQGYYWAHQAAATDAERARYIAVRDQLKTTINQIDDVGSREVSTRRMQPVSNYSSTTVFGKKDDVGSIRTNMITTFKGESEDPYEVVRWINKVLSVGAGQQLSQKGIINLLSQTSSGGVCDYIEELKKPDGEADLGEIITYLEMRYGELLAPETARVKCGSIDRNPGELITSFVDRLRNLARNATKDEPDIAKRKEEISKLVATNLVRILPPDVRKEYDTGMDNRKKAHLPPLKPLDIEAECIKLMRNRKELQASRAAAFARKPAYAVRAVAEPGDLSDLDEHEAISDTGELTDEEDGVFDPALIHEIRRARKHYAGRQPPVDEKKVYRKAFALARKKVEKPPQRGAVRAAYGGPPGRLQDGPRRSIMEMLREANCQRGECIHCGAAGHLMHNEACGLRGKPVTDRACMKCHKGLHAVDDCPRVYQTVKALLSEHGVVSDDQVQAILEALNE